MSGNRQKLTKTDRKGQKQKKMNREQRKWKEKWTETNRSQDKP